MAQLSRPYQILLGVVALLALVWVVALRGHTSNPSEPAPSAPSAAHAPPASSGGPGAASKAAEEARVAGTPTKVYHGPVPGLEGLTRDIAKAHEAVGASQREAKRFENASAQASSGSSPASAGAGSGSAHTPSSAATPPPSKPHTPGRARTTGTSTGGRPAQQVAVERDLAHRKTVMIVFWNPRSSVDAKVRDQANALAKGSKGGVVVYDAQPGQVGLFGPVTEVSHVYQTPTVLIVNKHGLISALTGLTDTFALAQAVREARLAK